MFTFSIECLIGVAQSWGGLGDGNINCAVINHQKNIFSVQINNIAHGRNLMGNRLN